MSPCRAHLQPSHSIDHPDARRVRSILIASSHCEIGPPDRRRLLGRYIMTQDGGLLLPALSVAGPWMAQVLRGHPSPPLPLWAADVAHVPQPHRVRGGVRMTGRLALLEQPLGEHLYDDLEIPPGEPVVAYVPLEARLEISDAPGAAPRACEVPIDAYRAAAPDPLAGWESDWLAHLARHDDEPLRRIVTPRHHLAPDDLLRPLRADADGLTFRLYTAGSSRDVHIPFRKPVHCGCEAIGALADLVEASGS